MVHVIWMRAVANRVITKGFARRAIEQDAFGAALESAFRQAAYDANSSGIVVDCLIFATEWVVTAYWDSLNGPGVARAAITAAFEPYDKELARDVLLTELAYMFSDCGYDVAKEKVSGRECLRISGWEL